MQFNDNDLKMTELLCFDYQSYQSLSTKICQSQRSSEKCHESLSFVKFH